MQSAKVEKKAARAEKKALDNSARLQSDMADNLASQMAASAARFAENSSGNMTPEQRRMMEKFSQDMAAAVEQEKTRKKTEGYDTSWIHDKQKRSEAVDEMAKVDKEMHKMGFGMQAGIERFMTSMAGPPDANGKYKMSDVAAGTDRMLEANPGVKDYVLILNYMGAFSDKPPPRDFDDMLNKIDPVLGTLHRKITKSPPAAQPALFAKLAKLQEEVRDMKSLKKSDKDSFSASDLAAKQKKWQSKVGDIFASMGGNLMEAMMAQRA